MPEVRTRQPPWESAYIDGIHADGASTDLLPFALTLARAGAAVIVPERSLLWPPTDESTNREGAVVICAEHWLVDHTKVFNNGEPTVNESNPVVREGFAYVGPRVCDPAAPSDCEFKMPFISEVCALGHYCRHSFWVPVGETEGGDNTAQLISDGGLKGGAMAPEASWTIPNHCPRGRCFLVVGFVTVAAVLVLFLPYA